jgi:hypothetical protein
VSAPDPIVAQAESLGDLVRWLRRGLAERHPLEEREIWDWACRLHVDGGFELEEAVSEAEADFELAGVLPRRLRCALPTATVRGAKCHEPPERFSYRPPIGDRQRPGRSPAAATPSPESRLG